MCQPVAVDGAKPGDAVAIRIKDIEVTSLATSSSNDQPMEGRFKQRPTARRSARAAGRSGPRPASRASGRSRCAARAAARTAVHLHQRLHHRIRRAAALPRCDRAARGGRGVRPRVGPLAALPDNSVQNPILGFAPHDIVALATRVRPFLGSSARRPRRRSPTPTTRATSVRSSSGSHRYALEAQELQRHKTDGHMDIDAVRAGAGPRLPGQTRRRRRLPGRHARAPGGDGGSPATPATCPAPSRCRSRSSRARQRRPDPVPRSEDLPFLARPLSGPERTRPGAGARAPARPGGAGRSRCRSR